MLEEEEEICFAGLVGLCSCVVCFCVLVVIFCPLCGGSVYFCSGFAHACLHSLHTHLDTCLFAVVLCFCSNLTEKTAPGSLAYSFIWNSSCTIAVWGNPALHLLFKSISI